ncbi:MULTISPECIES: hypothetical protein [Anaerotruncus]|uniref:Uncharacterized protein n=1 Tax=Anaerotruncus colihominis TaxID=169435 RepID=A0A845T1W6_9FIRM|nr:MULTISPECIES: hypothetical protein [Anaerotruncus]MCI8491960.1 hypothetical protein [Anaerotruncus sp.]MCR2025029.1 hypothetical protein [Anaerotruncus colihominis]NDO40127.1 hypothetical protein [Anaerotruncus colihominis]
MKKVLAVMLAAATTMSIGVTAFANDEIGNGTAVVSSYADLILDSGNPGSSSSDASSDTSSDNSSSSSSSDASSDNSSSSSEDESSDVSLENATDVNIGADEDGVVLGDDILEPGKEYKFPVSLTVGGKVVKITDKLMDGYKFSYSKISAKGMSRFEIEEYKGQYYLYVEARDTVGTKPVDVKYNVKLVRKSNNLSVFTQEVKFQYGYDEADSDYINGLDEGDVVEINNNNPVITGTMFDKIAKLNNYKNVTLAGNDWEFTVNVTDETTKNMVHNNAGIKAVLAAYPDQDFKFFSFPGKPSFSATGRMALNVDDIVDDFEKMYTYRYANGTIYRINATFDGDENTLTFRTNKLDNFFVTNKFIEDGTVVSKDDVTDSNGTTTAPEENKNNPSTGASDMINRAVMVAFNDLAEDKKRI